jgi:hypothetical protein
MEEAYFFEVLKKGRGYLVTSTLNGIKLRTFEERFLKKGKQVETPLKLPAPFPTPNEQSTNLLRCYP